MHFKKSKAVIAAVLSAAMAANAMVATISASAAGTRTKEEAFGDSTYAERFLSLYDDVMTHGVDNGYMSQNGSSSDSFGIPFHAVEEVIIEAPDYGHETTSEAMSYLVWVAAMRDNIAKNHADLCTSGQRLRGAGGQDERPRSRFYRWHHRQTGGDSRLFHPAFTGGVHCTD